MKQITKRICSVLLALMMVMTMFPMAVFTASAAGAAVQTTYATGDIITFGSYPQTKVTDSGLITSLNAKNLGAADTVTCGGAKCKRVFFTQYTPYHLNYTPTASYSFQDDNGYFINTVYWFKYEPIQWRVLSNTGGELFVMAEKILASREFDKNKESSWSFCTLRTWLNGEFYNTAFNSTEQAKIKTSTGITNDKLFLLSYSEVLNPAYGFSKNYSTLDVARRAQGTDFAKSNGLWVFTNGSYSGNSGWLMNASTDYLYHVVKVNASGAIDDDNYFRDTDAGVRPAIKLYLSPPNLNESFSYNNQVYNKKPATDCAEIVTNFSANTVENKGFRSITLVPSVPGDINGVGYLIAQKKVNANDTLILVAIQGTVDAQWQGNMDITGSTYNDSARDHSSFVNGKNIVKNRLSTYMSGIPGNKILLITGHSRGAAVANLLAMDMTNAGNKVFAYTFATPNTGLDAPGYYPNIFNFCFSDDFVCQSPLASWGYGKYGRTYWATANDIYASKSNSGFRNEMVKANTTSFNKAAVYSFVRYMSIVNPSRWSYYNLQLPDFSFPIYPVTTHFLLKDSIAPLLSNGWKIAQGVPLTIAALQNDGAIPIISFFGVGAATYISSTHQPNTYLQAIKYDLFFSTKAQTTVQKSVVLGLPSSTVTNPKTEEVQALRAFGAIADNAEKLGWNLDDVSTWTGVSWTDETENKVQSISWEGLSLTGTLDLSGFSSLVSLNVLLNSLESIELSGCSSLYDVDVSHNILTNLLLTGCTGIDTLNCSWNQLETLDITACSSVEEIYCENNQLATLDLADKANLKGLYCSNNVLTGLTLPIATVLESVDCSFNYLDIQPGSELMNFLEQIQVKENGWVNNSPQMIMESVAFNQYELDKLITFANNGNNRSLLEWDLDDPAIWPGVIWVIAGGEYRLQSLNVSALELTGTLDLSGFTSLADLNCDANAIESLDVSGCTSLKYVSCANGLLSELDMTGCAALLNVQCADNYLNISDGTMLRNVLDDLLLTNGIAKFEPQRILAPIEEFNAVDYAELLGFSQIDDNLNLLGWDLNKPGEWSGVQWKQVEGEYRAEGIDISGLASTGTLDLSNFDSLAAVDCAGSGISSISLPDSLGTIGNSAFADCNNLRNVTIPQGTHTIGDKAFSNCINLESVVLGVSTNTIGLGAFAGCVKLQAFTVPPENEFFNTYDGILFSEDGTTLVNYPPAKTATEYVVPNDVTSIEQGAFFGCGSLKRITLGESVKTIQYSAFSRCQSLEEIVLPEGLVAIETEAFVYCETLKEVNCPNSVILIGDNAFTGCIGLEKVIFNNNAINFGEHIFMCFDDEYLPLPLLTVHCYDGSPAYTYALANNIPVNTYKFTVSQGSVAMVNFQTNFIYGLSPGVSTLEGFLEPAAGYIFEYLPIESGFGTGTIVNIRENVESGSIAESYTVVIFGDVNGDGNIDTGDTGLIIDYENFLVDWNPTEDAAYLKAADLNGDENVDTTDAGLIVDAENFLLTVDQTTGLAVAI